MRPDTAAPKGEGPASAENRDRMTQVIEDAARHAGYCTWIDPDTTEPCGRRPVKARGLCAKHYHPAHKLPAESLTPREFAALVEAADGPRWTNKRDVALIRLLAASGLRIDEALSLTPDNIDWDRAPRVTIFVAHGKGDKSRKVSLGTSAQAAVASWLEFRDTLDYLGPDVPLFPAGSGRKLDDSQVRRLFRRLGKKAGITKRVHPHALRHTYAVEAVHAKKRPDMIQKQLGHTNLGTTTRYLSTIAPDEVIEEMFDL